ncbi:carbon-phosphorus lyase complex subunit [Ignatzschineria sp. LJL83]
MYVAVKGGEKAIENAHLYLDEYRRGNCQIAELTISQIKEQLPLAVSRVMSEGSLYDPELASLAIKQSAGDLIEAIFLLRAYRTTLSRFGDSEPLDTSKIFLKRRVSAVYKDVPGGQLLGPTFDYTHRLLDFTLVAENETPLTQAEQDALQQNAKNDSKAESETHPDEDDTACPHILDLLVNEGLMYAPDEARLSKVSDITRDPMQFPSNRSERLQLLVRADEGFLLALAYSTQRGWGRTHPFMGEMRLGDVEVWLAPEEMGLEIPIGTIEVTECEMVNQFVESADDVQFTRGYGFAFGYCERKAMAMALVERALRADEWDEERVSPAQDDEFVLAHCDNVESSGFVSHLKLPHYVDFQAELDLLRKIRAERALERTSERDNAGQNSAHSAQGDSL